MSAPQEAELLAKESFAIDRKTFVFDLKRNARGVYLAVSEFVEGSARCNRVLVPQEAFRRFITAVENVTKGEQ